MGAAGDAAAELMELGQAERIGVEDRHQGRIGNVDPDLDDTRRHEDIDLRGAKLLHHFVFFLRRHPAMDEPEAKGLEWPVGQMLMGTRNALQTALRFLDGRNDDIPLPPLAELAAEELPP